MYFEFEKDMEVQRNDHNFADDIFQYILVHDKFPFSYLRFIS